MLRADVQRSFAGRGRHWGDVELWGREQLGKVLRRWLRGEVSKRANVQLSTSATGWQYDATGHKTATGYQVSAPAKQAGRLIVRGRQPGRIDVAHQLCVGIPVHSSGVEPVQVCS